MAEVDLCGSIGCAGILVGEVTMCSSALCCCENLLRYCSRIIVEHPSNVVCGIRNAAQGKGNVHCITHVKLVGDIRGSVVAVDTARCLHIGNKRGGGSIDRRAGWRRTLR